MKPKIYFLYMKDSKSLYLHNLFSFNDGNQLFNNNFSLKTDSIEVVVSKLLRSGVQQKDKSNFLNK